MRWIPTTLLAEVFKTNASQGTLGLRVCEFCNLQLWPFIISSSTYNPIYRMIISCLTTGPNCSPFNHFFLMSHHVTGLNFKCCNFAGSQLVAAHGEMRCH